MHHALQLLLTAEACTMLHLPIVNVNKTPSQASENIANGLLRGNGGIFPLC
jgi:hypothetical protein